MNSHFYLAFILLAAPAVFSEEHRYCNLSSCPNRTHTLCKYPEAGAVLGCNTVAYRGLTMDEKEIVLDTYNRERPIVRLYELQEDSEPQSLTINESERGRRRGRGRGRGRGGRRWTYVYRMFWDNELEEIAQRWADQCTDGLDTCRHVERFDVRQRAYIAKTRSEQEPLVSPIIGRWFHDDNLPSLRRLNFTGPSIEEIAVSAADYLNRLVRMNENRIGCGSVRSFDNQYEYLHLVCNFGIDEPREIP